MICKVNPNTNRIYATYESIGEAARHYAAHKNKHGTHNVQTIRKRISDCVNGKSKTAFSYSWIRID